MCKLSNLYVLDLYKNATLGGIEYYVANSCPKLMNTPCKIVVKTIQVVAKVVGSADLSQIPNLRVIHNINVQSGSNLSGFSSSNTLAFIDSFQQRSDTFGVTPINIYGFTSTECTLYAPMGLPAILTLNKIGNTGNSTGYDDPNLPWTVRLEITINPDDQE
jgi:hypothetical protein